MKARGGSHLPDVAIEERPANPSKINRVGMSEIEIPLLIERKQKQYLISAQASAFVSLDQEHVKGIHMSRLFSLLQGLAEVPLSSEHLEQVVRGFRDSHRDLSRDAELRLSFSLMDHRTSLSSQLSGWRRYPVELALIYENEKIEWHLKYSVVYSSTCPCSAALSRQLIQKKFEGDFSKREKVDTGEISSWIAREDFLCATPHSQRSFAHVSVKLLEKPERLLDSFEDFISGTESCLKTPVQSMVKREDEQAFAKLNAENLMFCEDAARRIQGLLSTDVRVKNYSVEVEHQESLHPHNAVAKVWLR